MLSSDQGDQWSGKPWKSLHIQGINSLLSETLEKLGNFLSISWESGTNYIKSYLGESYSNFVHVVLWWIWKATRKGVNCFLPHYIISVWRFWITCLVVLSHLFPVPVFWQYFKLNFWSCNSYLGDNRVCLKKCRRCIETENNTVFTVNNLHIISLKVVSATFLLVCFLSLNESTCQTKKKKIYFTSKALFVLKKIKF